MFLLVLVLVAVGENMFGIAFLLTEHAKNGFIASFPRRTMHVIAGGARGGELGNVLFCAERRPGNTFLRAKRAKNLDEKHFDEQHLFARGARRRN